VSQLPKEGLQHLSPQVLNAFILHDALPFFAHKCIRGLAAADCHALAATFINPGSAPASDNGEVTCC
jgi:hypothetical protein